MSSETATPQVAPARHRPQRAGFRSKRSRAGSPLTAHGEPLLWLTGGALVTALAPICVDKFQRSPEAAANLTELRKVSSWQQGTFITKGGWATMPGATEANSPVADACATMLNTLKM